MALKTPIMLLQELMVSKRQPYPDYSFESVGDLLNPQFCCSVKASEVSAVAYGKNKKEAKQQAAANALKKIQNLSLKIVTEHSDDAQIEAGFLNNTKCIPIQSVEKTRPQNFVEGFNYIGQVNEYAAKYKSLFGVKYEDSIKFGSDQFQVNCILDNLITSGYAKNKKQAKQLAAFEMLELIKNSNYKPKGISMNMGKTNRLDEVDSKALEKFSELSNIKIAPVTESEKDVDPSRIVNGNVDSLDEAKEKLKGLNLSHAVEVLQEDPCIVTVQIKEKPVTAMGSGENKHKATLQAMKKALEALSFQ